ncbi:MAG TPA: TIGR03619 family F420-dependent LLM class oxidoreductase [Candidatus Limnocylindrales bacterium]|nr:TIGR03619 family F420-dependent LLM class oxidoreductase [Candidatus Limnocylindrales bacterium]
MDVHVALPNGHRDVTVDQLAEITDAAEELGFAGVWPLDHILVGPDLKDRYPWVIEPMTLLAFLGARTRRIRLGTSVIVLGMRNPFVVAKQAATVDLLCRGRFTLGLGAGYSEPEFRNVGAAAVWPTRGKRLDEAIALFRHLWSGSPGPFHGSFYAYEEGYFGPPPPQGARLPILIGGQSEAALNRAATLGDVWQSTGLSPDEFKPKAAWVRDHARGRRVEIGARTTLDGRPDAVLARVRAFEAAGAEHVCAYFGKRPEDFVPGMRAFAHEVMPALR